MNPPTEDHSSDRELEEHLRGDSEVSRRYRSTATDEPPAEVDRAILAQVHAQAREAAQPSSSKGVHFPRHKTVRWAVPFGLTATVALTFAVVHETGIDPGFAPAHVEHKARESSATGAAAPAETVVDVQINPPRAPEMELPALTLEPPPPDATVTESDTENSSISALAPPPPSGKAENVIVDPAPVELPRAINAPMKASPEQGFLGGRLKASSRALEKAQAPGGVQDAASSADGLLRQEPLVTTSTAAPVAASKKDLSEEKRRLPEAWLDDIRKLRAADKQVAAEAELKRFLETYPDYFEKHPDTVRP